MRISGVQRMRIYHYYWCRHCHRSILIAAGNPPELRLCPRCLTQLPPLHGAVPATLPRRRNNRRFDSYIWEPETDRDGPVSRSWIVLQVSGLGSRPVAPYAENVDPAHDEALRSSTGDGDFELFNDQELAPNNRPAGAPATEALRAAKVTAGHIGQDSECPICKEEYEVGGEVREMPCSHFYHSECILAWLRIHNSCPVCRYQLPPPSSSSSSSSSFATPNVNC
ncbi:E3 ubiquitin-protein ligase RDUF2-like [Malania oleifera]|uniref:E3 ubiquitin-protein ligase RDUF2-like n=1 Tax=Malania oleifera TaxID=397392 RepID=UPI0025AEA78A|nr:E3 ubiquitin-protein ligase RDUF2-like [Malania oleifera]